jgi:hypothetical protein
VNSEDKDRAAQLEKVFQWFTKSTRALPGIGSAGARDSLVRQIIESLRRVRYVTAMEEKAISPLRADPLSALFDPIKAAILHKQSGDFDEAFWLVFISVHFGKHRTHGWNMARDVYGALGEVSPWTWTRLSGDVKGFRKWLDQKQAVLLGGDGTKRAFGNHRKYQSLDAYKNSGTGAAVESYVTWIQPPRKHADVFAHAIQMAHGDPRKAFDAIYVSLKSVKSFGRMARFDYLNMVRKTGLAAIEPGSTYMIGATGPFTGARLLFGATATSGISRQQLDAWLIELGSALDIGMDVLEDAICNWQKSPGKFQPFRG